MLLAIGLGIAACSSSRRAGNLPDVSAISQAGTDLSTLMSDSDRQRLAALSAERAAAPSGQGTTDGYRIGPDDMLDVRIPDLLGTGSPTTVVPPGLAGTPGWVAAAPIFQQGVRVSASGDVNLPVLGIVRAQGLTPHELEAEIARRLVAAGILRAPQVSVLVAEYRSRVVAVIGSVERPGLYPVTRPGATIADLVWAAGGPSKDAGRLVQFSPAPAVDAVSGSPNAMGSGPADSVIDYARATNCAATDAVSDPRGGPLAVVGVDSQPNTSGHVVAIRLSRVPAGIHSFTLQDPPRLVIDFDRPTAEPRLPVQTFALTAGNVMQVRALTRPRGTLRTVLDFRDGIAGHQVRCDGATIIAEIAESTRGVLSDAPPAGADSAESAADKPPLIAESPSAPIRIDLALLLPAAGRNASVLNPQVRQGDVISLAPAGSVQVDGWVERPGSYPLTRNLTLSGALAAAGGTNFATDRSRVAVKRAIAPGQQRTFTVDVAAVAAGRAVDVPIIDGDVVYAPASSARVVPWGIWNFVTTIFRVGASVVAF